MGSPTQDKLLRGAHTKGAYYHLFCLLVYESGSNIIETDALTGLFTMEKIYSSFRYGNYLKVCVCM